MPNRRVPNRRVPNRRALEKTEGCSTLLFCPGENTGQVPNCRPNRGAGMPKNIWIATQKGKWQSKFAVIYKLQILSKKLILFSLIIYCVALFMLRMTVVDLGVVARVPPFLAVLISVLGIQFFVINLNKMY